MSQYLLFKEIKQNCLGKIGFSLHRQTQVKCKKDNPLNDQKRFF